MGENIYVGNNSGSIDQIGGRRTTYQDHAEPVSGTRPASGTQDGSPSHALYIFADIVGYSQLHARLQKISQDDLAAALDGGLTESGVQSERVVAQDQGDARLLTLPHGTDVGNVLAVLPRHMNDALAARNADMAPRARMRVRMSFAIGVSEPGRTGLVGAAPVRVARLVNADIFRHAMKEAPRVQCGVIIDDHLHAEYVQQRFRADIDPDDYVQVQVSISEKGFHAVAWIRLLGYSGRRAASLLASL
jgi:hypothetical protein